MGEIYGDFCDKICNQNEITELKCSNELMGNSLYIGYWKDRYVEFKIANPTDSENSEILIWYDVNGNPNYPNYSEFINMIKRTILFKFNLTLSVNKVSNIFKLTNEFTLKKQFIPDIWNLVNDNNYMLAKLFQEQDLFREIYGTCSNIYVTESLDPLITEPNSYELSMLEWKTRIKSAILILDYLKEIDRYDEHPIKLCNVKLQNFGITRNKLVKYKDLQYVYPESFIDRKLSNGQSCYLDIHCNYMDCSSTCDTTTQQCLQKQLNNNLQIVCKVIFKGTIKLPGILLTKRTPETLTQLIRRCINPKLDGERTRPNAASVSLRDNLYDELTYLYEVVASQYSN